MPAQPRRTKPFLEIAPPHPRRPIVSEGSDISTARRLGTLQDGLAENIWRLVFMRKDVMNDERRGGSSARRPTRPADELVEGFLGRPFSLDAGARSRVP